MAVSTDNYFSNSIIGVPQVGADIDVYASNTSPKYAVGFGFTRADGNKYRYCHFGLLSPAGRVVATDESESSSGMYPNCGALVANLAQPENTSTYANAVGSRYLQLVITATADQFAGSYVFADSGTGITYRVKGNTATSAGRPVTGNILVELYDPLVVAIDSNSDLTFTGCPYANVEPANGAIAATQGHDTNYIGVTVVGNTANSYGWVCTRGMIGVLQDAVVIGSFSGYPVVVSSLTAGTVAQLVGQVSYTNYVMRKVVGHVVNPGTVSDYAVINVCLE